MKFDQLYNIAVENDLVEEGLFDRIKARASGALAGGKQLGKNLKNVASAVTGENPTQTPEVKSVSETFRGGKVASLAKSFANDLMKTGLLPKGNVEVFGKRLTEVVEKYLANEKQSTDNQQPESEDETDYETYDESDYEVSLSSSDVESLKKLLDGKPFWDFEKILMDNYDLDENKAKAVITAYNKL